MPWKRAEMSRIVVGVVVAAVVALGWLSHSISLASALLILLFSV
jgi:hypothetical protein